MNYCKTCNSIIQNGICTNRRCTSRNEALTSWLIDGALWRFKRAVTYAEAQEAVDKKSELAIKIVPPKKEFIKGHAW